MPQTALRDVKRREAGMQKSQCFQGFSAKYEKRQQSMIIAHNPNGVDSNLSSATKKPPVLDGFSCFCELFEAVFCSFKIFW